MSPEEVLRLQGGNIKKLGGEVQGLRGEMQGLKAQRDADAQAIQALKLGNSFREVVRRAAEMIIPFHYIVNVVIPGASTQQIVQPITIGADGWFFADRVFASWRPTAGANAGLFMPLANSDPAIAVAAAVPAAVADVLNFVWQYSEDRTQRARQSQGLNIPGDLLYRRDTGYGYLLGGDPWAPATTVTVAVTPTIALANAGILTFTFFGEQCLHTGGDVLDVWVTRKRQLGI